MGNRWAGALRFIGIGWYIAACIVFGVLGGRWVGQQFDFNGSLALFIVLGVIIGIGTASIGVYRLISTSYREEEADKEGR